VVGERENLPGPLEGVNLSEDYYYRRHLSAADLMPAIGVGIAAGLAGFYLVQLLIQRTPLVPPKVPAHEPERPEPRSGPAGPWDRRPSG
jgi:hypothetical protein